MDGGATWHVCELDHPEKPNRYGKYWCWCFWSLEVEVLHLLPAKEIAVRAWDQSFNVQPEKLNWNLMGMMNNCWFRVKTNMCRPHKEEIGIVFEHPTQPGNQLGGWMAKERHLEQASADATLKKSVSSPFMNTSSKTFSVSEAKKLLEQYRIGELITTGYNSDSSSGSSSSDGLVKGVQPIKEAVGPARRVALRPGEKIRCKLVSKTSISHD
ncbi:hypothetical protein CRG98_022292, partial [Punica granatum]